MNYKDIQKTSFYLDTYSKIEEIKKDFPVNHGFLHINHVIANAKKLANQFKLNTKQRKLLYIACVLHDIGYLEGREDHALSGARLAKSYLQSLNFNDDDIEIICDAIARHGGRKREDYLTPISLCLVLADKLDFVGSRYNDKITTYPISPMFKAIKRLNLVINEKIILEFYTTSKFTKEEFEPSHFGKKLILVFSMLSEVLNKPFIFKYIVV